MFCCRVSLKGKKASPRRSPSQPLCVKVTVVGDEGIGKSSLIQRFCLGTLPKEYSPTLFDCTSVNVAVGHQQVQLVIQDTAGQKDLDRLRAPFYLSTDVVIVCFALDNPSSLNNVQNKWVPEARRCCGSHVPIVLVATKADVCINTDGPASFLNADRQRSLRCSGKNNNVALRLDNYANAADIEHRLIEFSSLLESNLDPMLRAATTLVSADSRSSSLVCGKTSDLTGRGVSALTKPDRSSFSLNLHPAPPPPAHHHQNQQHHGPTQRKNSKALSGSTRCLVQAQVSGDSDHDESEAEWVMEVDGTFSNTLVDVGRIVSKDVTAALYCVTSSARNVEVARVFQSAVEVAVSSKHWKKKFGRLML